MTKQETPTAAIKKIDWAEQFMNQYLQAFRCPYCHDAMVSSENHSVVCKKGHRFNISKKGTLHLMKQNANTDYDATLFQHRYELAQSGFFEPLLEAILPHLSGNEEKFIVDIGCGEGSHLSWISKYVQAPLCGMDIAKEGIHQASVHFGNQALFFLGDLANLPFADESCGTLLNILTPSNYQEFMRVLAPGGSLIKVIPGNDYLAQLRQQLYRSNPEKQTYSNADILERVQSECPQVTFEEVRYTVNLTDATYHHLLEMTPLYWGATPEDKAYSNEHPLATVTVHYIIAVVKKP
ncbi:methyltransferase domain-containing protein [uncultured Granulicatella sp.]|uniref:methyltransferase domain-containing protein n=1 Tax=uncultured Granulicatella sp. TaxID=316089 RepID=UPI00261D3E52|nr:methyltransferase domain-containing protein [uncultured Granulicatella sp.]